jgi:hypothetical protein
MIRAANAATEAADAATRQVGVAERSLGTTIDSFHLDQRAWVGPTRVEMKPMLAPDPIVAEVTCESTRNAGVFPELLMASWRETIGAPIQIIASVCFIRMVSHRMTRKASKPIAFVLETILNELRPEAIAASRRLLR